VHSTVVGPLENTPLDGGTQLEVTGGVPFVTVGAAYSTLRDVTEEVGVVAVTSAGQRIAGGWTGTQLAHGAVGLLWHPMDHRPAAATASGPKRIADC